MHHLTHKLATFIDESSELTIAAIIAAILTGLLAVTVEIIY